MAGSHTLVQLLHGTRARITALHQARDRLYAGCADGSVRVYDLAASPADGDNSGDGDGEDNAAAAPKLVNTYQFGRREIHQIGVLTESKLLVILSDYVVTLYNLANPTAKGASTVLTQARTAHGFAITTYFAPAAAHVAPSTDASAAAAASAGTEAPAPSGTSSPIKVARDLLVIGCRKKVCVYGAGRVLGEVWELVLPHSPRTVIFPAPVYADLPGSAHLLYSPQASVILNIHGGPPAQRLAVTELQATGYPPTRASAAAAPVVEAGGFSALSGFGGLLRAAAIPVGTRTVGGEVLLVRDDLGVFFSSEGNFTRNESLQWPSPPEQLSFANPFIYSVIAGTTHTPPLPTVEAHLAPTLAHRHSITFPAPSAGGLTVSALSVTGGKKSRVFMATTPTDRTLLANEGSTVWELSASAIGEQVNELVREGRVTDAIGLVEAVGDGDLSPTQKLPHLRVLHALTQFAQGDYKTALEAFVVHTVHPAKVVALYPEKTISGTLAVPREEWMSLFGAVEGARLEPVAEPSNNLPAAPLAVPAGPALNRKNSNETVRSSMSGAPSTQPSEQNSLPSHPPKETPFPRAAVDELIYYLSDRRQKLAGAIPNVTLPSEKDLPALASLNAADVHALPDGPIADLNPEQLLRTAQVVYTSLLKVYLIARPSLVGSLCRIENWCDVTEVEPLLREKHRYDDLRDLYMQKQMHDKALSMLLEQAKEEEDPLDRYPPTVRYLQKLGPSHLQLIFDSSRWIFEEDPVRGLSIFTADEPEVDALPRPQVVAFLEKLHPDSAVAYLEHIIDIGENGADFHDKLAELYLSRVRDKTGTEREAPLAQLLQFLNKSTQYRPYRLLSKLGSDDVPEARALLVGRMGNHDEALKIYVYKLKDYTAAEAYCTKVYAKNPDRRGIFLHLLKLYLEPAPPLDPLIKPALSLVSRHASHLDATSVLDLLPPLVPMGDLHEFFLSALGTERAKRNEHRVVRGLLAARKGQADRLLVGLEVKRVRITDQRTCPQCQKRLGTSAIAVHAPRGEVTHLHCKDLFSAKLAKARA